MVFSNDIGKFCPADGTTVTALMIYDLFGGPILVELIIAWIYTQIIYPGMFVAIGNMAYNEGGLGSAFRFEEISYII